jgi:hypothetical protein
MFENDAEESLSLTMPQIRQNAQKTLENLWRRSPNPRMKIKRFVHCYLLICFVLCEIYFLTSVS